MDAAHTSVEGYITRMPTLVMSLNDTSFTYSFDIRVGAKRQPVCCWRRSKTYTLYYTEPSNPLPPGLQVGSHIRAVFVTENMYITYVDKLDHNVHMEYTVLWVPSLNMVEVHVRL